MNIDKAIKLLGIAVQPPSMLEGTELMAALQLGIEALKGIKKVRKIFRPYVEALLPEETEE